MKKKQTDPIHPLKAPILKGSTAALSKAISLVESSLETHSLEAEQLLEQLSKDTASKRSNSIRIGVSGVPGVGKSTFIEALGGQLTKEGKKVAVLTIDPSSQQSGGSILGDKNRMQHLSQSPLAYIRTTPAAAHLGGVAKNTRPSIQLCEAAGFEVIIIETVGVGQSELEVQDMVDFFLLLHLPGAGDEIQGIKRGIMEVADALVVNKADGANAPLAKKSQQFLQHAIHAFPSRANHWEVPVLLASATEGHGIDQVWKTIEHYIDIQRKTGEFERQRQQQLIHGWHAEINQALLQSFATDVPMQSLVQQLEKDILSGATTKNEAKRKAIASFRGKWPSS